MILAASLHLLSEALNSSFAIALVGGFVGAVGGALGAQHIAERAKQKSELSAELRSTNAAIVIAFAICNAGLALKKQHVLPMWELFQRERLALEAARTARAAVGGGSEEEHRVRADLRNFLPPTTAIEMLKTLVYEKISAYGRAVALLTVLDQSLVGLTKAIEKRSEWVQRFSSNEIGKDVFLAYYFGMKLPSGDTNQEYPDLVFAITDYVDDIIFFSSLLCEDLMKHGEAVRMPLLKISKNGIPRVSQVDMSGPRANGLLPPQEKYSDWINAFTEQTLVKQES